MRLKKIIFSAILVFISSIITLLVVEISLRFFYPQQESMRWFESSNKYGYLLKKKFSQDYSYTGHEFTMHVRTNSFGHRYKEYNKANFDNTKYKKVLLLGDSFMFGHGVNMEDHIATHLENMLNKDDNFFSIINAGVGAWGTLQEVAYAKDNFQLFNPDFIILLFCGNDPDDDNEFLANMKDVQKGLFYFPGKIFLRDYSHLYRFLAYRYYKLLHFLVLKEKSKNNENIIINEQGGNAISYEQWERTLKVIKEFHTDYLKFNKAGILLVFATSPWDKVHREKLSTLSNGQNLFFVDLYSETITLPSEKRTLEHDSHWSKSIHFISAKRIAESILRHKDSKTSFVRKGYGDKGYYGQLNRAFLYMNGIKDGVIRKDTTTAKLTELEIERNKRISKKGHIVEQYFGLSYLHDGAYRARFTKILKNIWDTMCRQTCPVKCVAYFSGVAFNMFRGFKLLAHA